MIECHLRDFAGFHLARQVASSADDDHVGKRFDAIVCEPVAFPSEYAEPRTLEEVHGNPFASLQMMVQFPPGQMSLGQGIVERAGLSRKFMQLAQSCAARM